MRDYLLVAFSLYFSLLPAVSFAQKSAYKSLSSAAGARCVAQAFETSARNEARLVEIAGARELMAHQLTKNFKPNGAVLAAEPGVNPDYDATWLRDSAHARVKEVELALGVANQGQIPEAINHLSAAEAEEILKTQYAYVNYLRTTQDAQARFGQVEPDPHDPVAVLTMSLGEPRFRSSDGQVITDPSNPNRPAKWGRTQNDSPAEAAKYLALLSRIALKAGKADWVKNEIFDTGWPASNGVLKRYVEYIVNEGRSHGKKTYEAWEEKSGHHFGTALVQSDSLNATADLVDDLAARAENAGNHQEADAFRAASRHYRNVAVELKKIVDERHWNSEGEYIEATVEADTIPHAEKTIHRDALVINSLLHSSRSISLTDEKVLSTVALIEKDNRDAETGAVPIGRYKQDIWQGKPPESGEAPKPGSYRWTLLTADWLEIYARDSIDFDSAGVIDVTPIDLKFFSKLDPTVKVGVFKRGSTVYSRLMERLKAKRDDYGKLILKIVGKTGITGEGFDPKTFEPSGPKLLAWNAVEIIDALDAWASSLNPSYHPAPILTH